MSANGPTGRSFESILRRLGDADDATALTVLRQEGLADQSGLTRVLDHAEVLVHRDPEVAHRLVMVCDQAAQPASLTGILARARYQRAQILAERDDLEAAMELITQARQLWLESGNVLGALRTNVGLMQVLDDLGQPEVAVQVGDKLITALDALPPDTDRHLIDQVRAHATENLGVAYGFTGQHTLALENYDLAEQAYLRLGMLTESARSRANRGVELMALGRLREGLSDLLRAEKTFTATGDDLFAAQCRGEAAGAHRQLGEFAQALELLEQARQTLHHLGAAVEADRLQLTLAETYLDAGLWSEANTAANAAVTSATRAGRAHDAAMGNYLAALSDLARGHPRNASRSVAAAEALFTDVGDRQYAARARLARAEAQLRTGDTDQARELLHQCVEELRLGGWTIPLACGYLHQTDVAESLDIAQDRLSMAAPLVDKLGMPELTYQYQLRAGKMNLEHARPDAAERNFRRAITALGDVTGNLPDHVLRTAFRADRFTAHNELVKLLVNRGRDIDILEASRVADAAKVQTLTELRSRSRTNSERPVDEEIIAASAELSATYQALHREELPAARDELTRRAELLEQQVTVLRLRHHHSHLPGSADTDRRETPSDIILPASQRPPVLAFHATEEDIIVFVTVNAKTSAHRLPGAFAHVHDLLDALKDQWSRYALGLGLALTHRDSLLSTTQDILASLHTLLIEPVQHLIDPTHEQLWIVPHARMGPVPFHALFDGRHYLLEKWAITLAPTSDTRPTAATSTIDTGPSVVVAVADPYAPAVSREALLIAKLLPHAVVLVDEQATTTAFIAASAGAKLIHLASHGVHRASSPLFSRLRFADRWMTSAEIIDLDLTGALVTLSACETGAHDRAAEPIGLGWAFLAAGAAGVVVSTWEVHDEATLTLMSELYRLLAAGSPPAQALRDAQVHTAEDYPHPFYWAPFSYVTSPLTTRSTHP